MINLKPGARPLATSAALPSLALLLSACTIDATWIFEDVFAETTASPSATASQPTPTPTVLTADGVTALNAVFPAETDPDYVYSNEPQSNSEVWLAEQFPDQWALGVRAVSGQYVSAYTWGDPLHFAVLVQYIDGVRYEGTQAIPLGFRGQIEDPLSLPTDAYEATLAVARDGGLTEADVGNFGQGGYRIVIGNSPDNYGVFNTIVYEVMSQSPQYTQVGGARHDSWEEALAALQDADFYVEATDRTLYPGEIAGIMIYKFGTDVQTLRMYSTVWVYNPNTGEVVLARDIR